MNRPGRRAERRAPGRELQGLIRDIQVGFSTFHALALTPWDVSIAQFAVLLCLAQQQPRKMSEVARALHVSLPAVTHLVDRLETKRMLRRKAHPTDRRVSLIEMTDRGRTLLAQTQGRTLHVLTTAFLRHSATERKTVFTFMKSLRAGIRKAVQDVERSG